MPTLDKIETLAVWLDVPLQQLRFGIPESAGKHRERKTKAGDMGVLATYETELATRLRAVSEVRRKLIVDLTEQLSLDEEIWTG